MGQSKNLLFWGLLTSLPVGVAGISLYKYTQGNRALVSDIILPTRRELPFSAVGYPVECGSIGLPKGDIKYDHKTGELTINGYSVTKYTPGSLEGPIIAYVPGECAGEKRKERIRKILDEGRSIEGEGVFSDVA